MPKIRVSGIVLRGEDEPEILLMRHRRRGRSHPVLPGGKVELDETLLEAFHRELKEETGLVVTMENLAIIADVIPPDEMKHVVNLIFRGNIVGGEFRSSLKGSPTHAEHLDQAYFVPLADLGGVDLFPRIFPELREVLSENSRTPPLYLGNVWRDHEDELK